MGKLVDKTTGMQNEEKKKIYNKLFKRGIHVWYRVEVDWKNKLYWQLYSPKVRKMRGLSFGYLHISLPSPLLSSRLSFSSSAHPFDFLLLISALEHGGGAFVGLPPF